jgi:hypothetical protein
MASEHGDASARNNPPNGACKGNLRGPITFDVVSKSVKLFVSALVGAGLSALVTTLVGLSPMHVFAGAVGTFLVILWSGRTQERPEQ